MDYSSEEDAITLFIHHGGLLVETNDGFHYEGGSTETEIVWDTDRFGFFDLCGLIEKIGYVSWGKIAYNIPVVEAQLKYVFDDEEVMDIVSHVAKGNKKIDIYVHEGIMGESANRSSKLIVSEIEHALNSGPAITEDEPMEKEDGLGNDSDVYFDSHETVMGKDSDGYYDVFINEECDSDSEDLEYCPVEESDTDDELDDSELASDDEEYIQARQNKVIVAYDAREDNNNEKEAQNQDITYVSDYEDSDGEVNSNTSSEEGQDFNSQRKKKISYDPKCDHNTLAFTLGMKFEDGRQCRSAIQKYGIYQGFGLRFVKSSRKRVEAKCKAENCKWRIYGSMVRHDDTFEIKSYYGVHECHRKMTNSLATASWIASEYLEWFRLKPNSSAKELILDVMHKYSVELSVWKCYRAKRKAMGMLRGSVFDHYASLRRYQAELYRVDERGKFEFLLEDDGCFKGFYVGFSALIEGFKKGCRSIIGFDGCFLKTFLGGALLAAVGKDGNNQIYPIAWAVVQSENEFFWKWFLKLLFGQLEIEIEDGFGWTFISDQQKGLLNAMKQLTPNADVRNCARHIYCNWKKDHKGTVLKNIFWRAVRSTHKADFTSACNDLKDASEGAYKDFIDRDPTKWCKVFISHYPKCDMVDNNVCETFNGYILKSRSKHIIDMLQDIKNSLMERFHDKLNKMCAVNDNICPMIRKKLEANKHNSRLCDVRPAVGGKFQVTQGEDQFIVDMNSKSCSCRAWDISGIPCPHACKGIYFMKKDPADFVHEYYSVRRYLDAYSVCIEPTNGDKMWPEAEGSPIKPPPFRSMPGRPKKKRKRTEIEENTNRYKLPRTGVHMTCSKCGKRGHNMRSCKDQPTANQTSGPSTKAKRGRPKKSVGVTQSTRGGRGKQTRTSTTSAGREAVTTTHRRQSKEDNHTKERRQSRQGYGLRIFHESGNVYFRSPGSSKVKFVHGPSATANASKTALNEAGPSVAVSNVSSQAATRSRGVSETRGGRSADQFSEDVGTQESAII